MPGEKENGQDKPLTRSELIRELSNAVKIVSGKVTAERVRSGPGDETRLKYARVLAQLAPPLLTAIQQEQYDEILRRVEDLERRT